MASTTVQQLRNDLEECKAEVGKMEEIVRNINTAISKAESLKIENETMTHLREQKAQLVKDIDNYKHMLQEAEDLKKSWDKVINKSVITVNIKNRIVSLSFFFCFEARFWMVFQLHGQKSLKRKRAMESRARWTRRRKALEWYF